MADRIQEERYGYAEGAPRTRPFPSEGRANGGGIGERGLGDLKGLLGALGRDASQLAHDELTLAKIELRDIAEGFRADIQEGSRTLVKDMAKVGLALSLATLAGLALTAGAILAVGRLLDGAFWAGGLIVGAVLLIAAAIFATSAGKDLEESDALRMERGRDRLERDTRVLKDEARETGDFASEEGREFKRRVTADRAERAAH